MVTLNTGYDRYKVYLYDLGYDIDISKNALVYGKRGSGKTFLCRSLIKKLVGSEKIEKEVIDNYKICYIKQGDYINENKIENYLVGDVRRRKVKLQRCCDLFRESFDSIDDYHEDKGYGKSKISDYLQMFIRNLICNISENIKDKYFNLKAFDKKFENFIHYNKNNPYESNCKICIGFINKIKKLIKDFSDNKDVLNSNDGKIQEFINNLKEIIPTLVEKLEKMCHKKEIENFRIEIYEKINESINKEWQYTFNFDFFNYFKARKIKELYEQFIGECNDEFISCSNDRTYGFKREIEHDSNDYFSIKSFKKIDLFIKPPPLSKEVEASEGQKREFLILKKLEEKDWIFFILDEPEYAFDNAFLKNKLAQKINSILQNESKKCWIITHNHVLWSEIFGKIDKNKSYMLCNFSNGVYKYEQKTNDIDCDFMEIYEAGNESYTLRNGIYKKRRR